jgi:hypothetical protein
MTAAVLASAAAGFSAPVEILPSQMTASVGSKCLSLSTPRPERGQTEVKVDKNYSKASSFCKPEIIAKPISISRAHLFQN